MSIYVLQDKENEQEVKQLIEKAVAKGKLDRAALGQHVWTSGNVFTVLFELFCFVSHMHLRLLIKTWALNFIHCLSSRALNSEGSSNIKKYRRQNRKLNFAQIMTSPFKHKRITLLNLSTCVSSC